jgi:uncharacterized membrane protein HdeD (DUF308 family)
MGRLRASPTLDALASRWWVPILRGAAALVFGVLAMTWPGEGALALVLLWGGYAVVDGVANVMTASRRSRSLTAPGWLVVEGFVGIAAGILAFVRPGMTLLVLVGMVAVWAILTGIARLVAAIALRREIDREWVLGGSGVLAIAFGGLLLAFPSAGAAALVMMLGAYAFAFGGMLLGFGLRLHEWRGRGARTLSTNAAPSIA